jgi:dTMP kinase
MVPFITFEGGEGSGKTAQAKALHRKLLRAAVPALLIYEPGGTPLGRRIGRWLKWGRAADMSPLSELLLFNASRAQLVRDIIEPNLKNGMVVICDRYTDSTVTYQGYARGLDLEEVHRINTIATGGLCPDLTVLLDIPVEEGFARKKDRSYDRFEQEDIAFHRRVREGYLALAAAEPERWLVIDARQSRGEIARLVWPRVSRLLGEILGSENQLAG